MRDELGDAGTTLDLGERVFGAMHNIEHFDIRSYGLSTVRQAIADYCGTAAESSLRVRFSAVCDAQEPSLGLSTLGAQQERIDWWDDALADITNATGEGWNEAFKNANGIDTRRVRRPRRALWASGDYDIIGRPDCPVWDTFTNHEARKIDWSGEAVKSAAIIFGGWTEGQPYPGAHVPIEQDEPIGVDEVYREGKRDNRPDAVEDGYLGFGLMAATATIHTEGGIRSEVPGPIQTACAKRAAYGMTVFPNGVQQGHYSHDGVGDFPLENDHDGACWEVAGRFWNGHWYIAAAVKMDAEGRQEKPYRPQPKPGRRIVSVLNAHGNALVME